MKKNQLELSWRMVHQHLSCSKLRWHPLSISAYQPLGYSFRVMLFVYVWRLQVNSRIRFYRIQASTQSVNVIVMPFVAVALGVTHGIQTNDIRQYDVLHWDTFPLIGYNVVFNKVTSACLLNQNHPETIPIFESKSMWTLEVSYPDLFPLNGYIHSQWIYLLQ